MPRLLLWGTLWVELLRLRECERSAVCGRTGGVGGAEAAAWVTATLVLPFIIGPLLSLVGDWPIREEIERGQETERRMNPERAGEDAEPALTGLGEGFQYTRPASRKKKKHIQCHRCKPFLCSTPSCFCLCFCLWSSPQPS